MNKIIPLISLLTFLNLLFAEQGDKIVTAYKTAQKITIDGKLDEPVWQKKPEEDFLQRDPEEGQLPSEKTFVWVAYDENNIYVAAKCTDGSPDLIDKSIIRRDNFTNSDWFAVYLDSYYDKTTGYYFIVNAGGSMVDGILYNDSWQDSNWDGIWIAETTTDENGWNVEMKIPLSQIRFNEKDDVVWGINFRRDIKRKNERNFFSLVPKTENGFVSKFATLDGLEGLKAPSSIDLFPYIVQKANFLQHDANDPYHKTRQFPTTIGADIKYSISSNLTMNGTINPDFGQVEVDPAVINLSAFETYYDEKRPFFTEGWNYFTFGSGGTNNNWGFNFGFPELFYSRRIGRYPQGEVPENDFADAPKETRILGAAKITGQIGNGWSLGVMDAMTQRTYAKTKLDSIESSSEIEPFTNYGLIRVKKEFDKGRHALGMIFTGVNRNFRNGLRESLTGSAYTFGAEGWTTLDDSSTYVLNTTVVGSYIEGSRQAITSVQERSYRYLQRPDATYMRLDSGRTSLTGWYARTMLNKQKGNFYLNTSFGVYSPGFEYNDMGFQWLANRINGHLVLGYRWYKPQGIFREKGFYIAHSESYDFEGDLTNNTLFLNTYMRFLNYYYLQFRGSYNFEDYNYSATRGGPKVKDPGSYRISGFFHTDSRKDIVFEFNSSYSRDKNSGRYFDIESDINWRPTSSLSVSFGPEYSIDYDTRMWVDNREDNFAVNTYKNRYIFAELNQKTISGNIRINWSFSPKVTLEFFLQPLISVGTYNRFHELAAGRSNNYNYYGENGSTITYSKSKDSYYIDPDGTGPAEEIEVDNPDFNFKSLRANLVFRWEIQSGSVFYFVWTQEKTDEHNPGEFSFNKDFKNLLRDQPDNIFLIKYSHWLSI